MSSHHSVTKASLTSDFHRSTGGGRSPVSRSRSRHRTRVTTIGYSDTDLMKSLRSNPGRTAKGRKKKQRARTPPGTSSTGPAKSDVTIITSSVRRQPSVPRKRTLGRRTLSAGSTGSNGSNSRRRRAEAAREGNHNASHPNLIAASSSTSVSQSIPSTPNSALDVSHSVFPHHVVYSTKPSISTLRRASSLQMGARVKTGEQPAFERSHSARVLRRKPTTPQPRRTRSKEDKRRGRKSKGKSGRSETDLLNVLDHVLAQADRDAATATPTDAAMEASGDCDPEEEAAAMVAELEQQMKEAEARGEDELDHRRSQSLESVSYTMDTISTTADLSSTEVAERDIQYITERYIKGQTKRFTHSGSLVPPDRPHHVLQKTSPNGSFSNMLHRSSSTGSVSMSSELTDADLGYASVATLRALALAPPLDASESGLSSDERLQRLLRRHPTLPRSNVIREETPARPAAIVVDIPSPSPPGTPDTAQSPNLSPSPLGTPVSEVSWFVSPLASPMQPTAPPLPTVQNPHAEEKVAQGDLPPRHPRGRSSQRREISTGSFAFPSPREMALAESTDAEPESARRRDGAGDQGTTWESYSDELEDEDTVCHSSSQLSSVKLAYESVDSDSEDSDDYDLADREFAHSMTAPSVSGAGAHEPSISAVTVDVLLGSHSPRLRKQPSLKRAVSASTGRRRKKQEATAKTDTSSKDSGLLHSLGLSMGRLTKRVVGRR